MIDAGENVNVTLKREFSEEAMNSLELPAAQVAEIQKHIDKLFSEGKEVSYSVFWSIIGHSQDRS